MQYTGIQGKDAGNPGIKNIKASSPIQNIVNKAADNSLRLRQLSENIDRLLVKIRGPQPEGVADKNNVPNSSDFISSLNSILLSQQDSIAECENKLNALQEMFD